MNLDKWQSQIRKGTLELIILLALNKTEYYGYELIRTIRDTLDMDMSEGTIYPILTRLKKAELVSSRWDHAESGMPRKYYQITNKGLQTLQAMTTEWKNFSGSIDKLMESK